LTLSGIFNIPQPSTPPHPLCFQAFSTCFNPIQPFSIIYAWSQCKKTFPIMGKEEEQGEEE